MPSLRLASICALTFVVACEPVEEGGTSSAPRPAVTETPVSVAGGGIACFDDDAFCVAFPAGAFSEDVVVSLQRESIYPTPEAVVDRAAFEVSWTPESATFSGSATLTFMVDAAAATAVAGTLRVAYVDAIGWSFDGIATTARVPGADRHQLVAETIHMSTFAVVDGDVALCPCDETASCDDGPDGVCSCDSDCINEEADLVVYPHDAAGSALPACQPPSCTVDLGNVPLFSTVTGRFTISNQGSGPAVLTEAVLADTVGNGWSLPSAAELPVVLHPGISFAVQVAFSPTQEETGSATVEVGSNAAGSELLVLKVTGSGLFSGAPDIELAYGTAVGPEAGDCVDLDLDGTIDGCEMAQPFDLGVVAPGIQTTGRLTLRNVANCTPTAGSESCSTCELTIAADPTRQGIGLGFQAGSNSDGAFAFAGSTNLPFGIRQRELSVCNETGEVRLLLDFDAPMTEGDYQTVVVVESNDPDEPLVEVPVVAHVRNGPVAIARFRELDPLNPSAPYTDPAHIVPLSTLYFDGRGSYDPSDPQNPAAIAAWQWEVIEYPADTNPNDFNLQGQTSGLFSFWAPTVGHYVVRLQVWNAAGIQSGDTPDSRVEFDVLPTAALLVQLTWDNASNDQDLHLVNLAMDDRVCNQPADCFWLNKTPVWFTSAAFATGPNPHMDIDDTNGLGPENVLIDLPEPGSYRIFVHYWGDFSPSGVTPTRNTVRVVINGVPVAEYRRTLTEEKAIWAVADVTWNADGTAVVAPYPSDAAGEVGSIDIMQDCQEPGWSFP